MDRLDRLRPSEALTEIGTAIPGPFIFCYRQSPASLVPWSTNGQVSAIDPPPGSGDVHVELDLGGRLLALRVVPPDSGDAQPSSSVNWAPLFAAAHLGAPEAFAPVSPQWWPESAADVREAREGMYAGHRVRVEAAARAGRPIFFRLVMPWTATPQRAGAPSARTLSPQRAGTLTTPLHTWSLAFWISFIVLAALARRNLRLGRSDRAAALALAIAVVVTWTAAVALGAHSAIATLVLFNGPGLLAQPLMLGLFAWLGYVGFEPQIRRAWPHLLITSTRLLNGRWRDPLVGRALLAGVLVGLIFSLPVSMWMPRWLDLAGGGPTNFLQGTLDGARGFVGSRMFWLGSAPLWTVLCLAVLLSVRLVVRRADVAWAVFSLLMVGWGYMLLRGLRPVTTSPLLLLAMAGVFWLALVWLLWKHGALALAVAFLVDFLVEGTPWTLDMSRWYAWRGPFAIAVIAALAFWGFRNALGRQSVFPAGALDG